MRSLRRRAHSGPGRSAVDGTVNSARSTYWMWDGDVGLTAQAVPELQHTARRTLTASAMIEEGPAALLAGWLPREPLIDTDTRVIAIGRLNAAVHAGS